MSDAVSPGFWCPVWHRYYSGQFGPQALHLITYDGRGPSFSGFALGSVICLPEKDADAMRAQAISFYVERLLIHYDIVIGFDFDEILCPDVRLYPDLKTYVERLDRPM